MVTDRDT